MKTLTSSILLIAAAIVLSDMPFGGLAMSQEESVQKRLRHVVLFNFKDDATDDQIRKIVQAFGELPDKIKVIEDYEWGTNNSPEGLDQGFTHCFFVTFKSEEDRDTYLPHPAHQAFVEILRPALEEVLVVDYWAHE